MLAGFQCGLQLAGTHTDMPSRDSQSSWTWFVCVSVGECSQSRHCEELVLEDLTTTSSMTRLLVGVSGDALNFEPEINMKHTTRTSQLNGTEATTRLDTRQRRQTRGTGRKS